MYKKIQLLLFFLFKKHGIITYQVLYWLIYFVLTMINNQHLKTPYPFWLVVLIGLLIVGITYTFVYLLARAFPGKYMGLPVFLGAFLTYALLFYMLIYKWLPYWGYVVYDPLVRFNWLIFFYVTLLKFYHTLMDAGLLVAVYRVRQEEKEKRKALEYFHQAKLQFLMSQLSPHFIYNFDNKVLAIAARTSPELVKPLEQRDEVLRYVTEHADKFTREVPLKDEVDYAQKLALAYGFAHSGMQLYVRLHDDRPDHTIIPMLSSPLLENACEYGIYWEAENPITLDFYGAMGSLRIVCRNKINSIQHRNRSTGIGLSNLRQRLNLVYGDRAALEIVDDGVFYEVIIHINYEEKTNR